MTTAAQETAPRLPLLSVLDRSLTRQGQRPELALRDTVHFARHIEQLGYHRFWVSEHHGVPGVAGSAPTVLASAVAAATTRIRVGTGGVMLPNHRPLVVAEQFGVLESLYPGRIDMGLGRSVGFTDGVRRALGVEKDAAAGFGDRLTELLGYFEGTGTGTAAVRAVPARGLRVPAFLLAVGSGADLAAEQGLPLVIAAQRDEQRMLEAIGRYREDFQPSALSPAPYVMVAVNAAVAGDGQAAELLQIPEAWSTVQARTVGAFTPLIPAAEVVSRGMNAREANLFAEARQAQLRGTEEQMAGVLARLTAVTGADELLLTLNTYDQADRLDSYRRLARLAGQAPPASGPPATESPASGPPASGPPASVPPPVPG